MSLKDGKRLDAISVPSSSGKSLQPHDCDSYFVLYSISVPSSSGKSLQHYDKPFAVVANENFSPLFIGEITSTSSQHRFQSRLRHFSPLFIGEITSTAAHPTRGKGKYKFQSPLHRGNHFNATAPGISRGHWRISVPSSSGKSLQPVLLWERRAKEIDFSPLFIGEITSTPWEAASTALLTDFSPLFIGEITSTKDVPARSCHRGNFSPLFIGEITSTRGRA